MPRENENGPEMKMSLENDVKVSFMFAEYKLVVPWTMVYESKTKLCLKRFKIKFYHDDFDIQRISHLVDDVGHIGSNNQCPPFDIVYEWEAIQEEDLALAVIIMFTLTLVVMGVLAYIAITGHENKIIKSARTAPSKSVAGSMTGNPFLLRKPAESLRRHGF